MSGLVSELEACRVQHNLGLRSVDLSIVTPFNPSDALEVKGRIAEAYVTHWLNKCPSIKLDTKFPREVNGYLLEQENRGIVVYTPYGEIKKEFDNAFFYEGKPYIVEVKSMRLNGFEKKIDSSLRIGREIYGDDVSMLLFLPFHSGKSEDAKRIEDNYSNINCVDLDYRGKDLNEVVDMFYMCHPEIRRIDHISLAKLKKTMPTKKSRKGRRHFRRGDGVWNSQNP